MTELEASPGGDPPPPYMIFVVVFLFFVTGLLGFLVCHLLKKKGYRCRTGDMEDEEEVEEEEKLGGEADEDEENQDTVEQILRCIIENEANMEAFNEMLGNHNVCVRHDPRLRKESVGGAPPHHHTVHSGADHNSCHLCAQGRSKKGRRQSRTPRSKQRPGEQTVFSVGRFRVTHHDKKLRGPGGLGSSGDQLDQSQDSEERKEGGYNLRSMFKDVRPPAESSGGAAPGKRRKSVTLFGLRRSSDPAVMKAGEATGRDAGAVRFAIQKQPVVLEERLTDDITGSLRSPQTQVQTDGPDPAPGDGSKHGPRPEPGLNQIKPTASAPVSLHISSPASSAAMRKGGHFYDSGPLQTSTPISPTPGFTAVAPPVQPERVPVTQTPDLDPGFDASLALISLGSSPQSSARLPSSASSLKSLISPVSVASSPKASSEKPPGGSQPDPVSPQSPSSPADHNLSIGSSPRLPLRSQPEAPPPKGDEAPKEPEPEGAGKPKTEEKRAGILKVRLSPGEAEPKPTRPSPSSPSEGRVSSVTVVTGDSRRQFSVVTMVEEEESSSSARESEKEVQMEDIRGCRVTQEAEEEEETRG